MNIEFRAVISLLIDTIRLSQTESDWLSLQAAGEEFAK